jgi:hypothetical protein
MDNTDNNAASCGFGATLLSKTPRRDLLFNRPAILHQLLARHGF